MEIVGLVLCTNKQYKLVVVSFDTSYSMNLMQLIDVLTERNWFHS